MPSHDIVIVGAGVAGLTAADHAARTGASVLVLDRLGVGGQVATVDRITNFPGQDEPIAGYELGPLLQERAEEAGAEFMLTEVARLTAGAEGFTLHTDSGEVGARTVIIAAGSTRRALEVPGEAQLVGRGVSHCASCDGGFFRGGRVAVVGGGDSAFDEAQILADVVGEVLIFHDGPVPTARPDIQAEAVARANIRLRPNATVSAIHGAEAVNAVTLRDTATGDEAQEPIDGVFVYIGLAPNTDWLADLLARDDAGRIVVDARLATSCPGIFAAGDIRSGSAAMLAESAADGTLAAQSALAFLSAQRAEAAR